MEEIPRPSRLTAAGNRMPGYQQAWSGMEKLQRMGSARTKLTVMCDMSEARVRGRIAGENIHRENFSESRGWSCHSLMVLWAGLIAIAVRVLAGCAHPPPMPSAKSEASEEAVRFG